MSTLPVLQRMQGLYPLLLFAALLIPIGCNAPRTSDRDLVFVTNSEAVAALEPRGRVMRLGGEPRRGIFVDPRTRREFIAGHIPGAIHVPFEQLRERSDELRSWEPLILYGNDPSSPVAAAASKVLMELGHRDVRTLRGGFKGWRDEEKPIATGEGSPGGPPRTEPTAR